MFWAFKSGRNCAEDMDMSGDEEEGPLGGSGESGEKGRGR